MMLEDPKNANTEVEQKRQIGMIKYIQTICKKKKQTQDEWSIFGFAQYWPRWVMIYCNNIMQGSDVDDL